MVTTVTTRRPVSTEQARSIRLKPTFTPVVQCRICGNTQFVEILDLGYQYLTGRFPRPAEPEPPHGPLKLIKCHGSTDDDHCGLLQLAHNYALDEMYGSTYGYRSSISGTMVNHLRAKAEALVERAQPKAGDLVLDIGCNDGTLLKCYPEHLRRFGMDPSSVNFVDEFPSDITLITDFFSKDKLQPLVGDQRFKIITAIAMFYDLGDPTAFMKEVHDLLAPDGVWEFEQSYMPGMLDKLAYDTVCHEHLSYYGLRQIKWMTDRVGLKILDVTRNEINGASFSVVVARQESPYQPAMAKIEALLAEEVSRGLATLAPYVAFREKVVAHRQQVLAFFEMAKREGKRVLGYGASTKGNVVIQYCGLTRRELPAIAEKYSVKFGARTPGTAIPIISEEEALLLKPDYYFVFPWHYRNDIVQREAAFVENGGVIVFPLPHMEQYGK